MSLLIPTGYVHRVTDITAEDLSALQIRALLVDIDNTLAVPDSQTPLPGTLAWGCALQDAGFRMILMSNNSEERVRPFARLYGLPFFPMSRKPLPGAFLCAARQLGIDKRESVVIGDQVYTDILGANLAGMKSVLTDPVLAEPSLSFRLRRRMERPVREKMRAGRAG